MSEEKRDRTNASAGFTLVEILLVVAIIGILATVVVVNFGGKAEGAKIKACRGSIQNICTAIDLFEVEKGKYPATLEDLTRSIDGAAPYIRGGMDALTDPWGVAFHYENQGQGNYLVKSGGPDGQVGTEDDVTSFETK